MTRELFNLLGAVALLLLGVILPLIGWRFWNKDRRSNDWVAVGLLVVGSVLGFVGVVLIVPTYYDYSKTFPSGSVERSVTK